MEYTAAKRTICRQCGSSFAPSAPIAEPRVKLPGRREEPQAAAEPSMMQRFEGLWNRHQSSVVECFDCKRKQEVSGAATSTTCPSCSSHIDLRDYKITTAFSRAIKTRGDVHLTAKGDLSSTTVTCMSALVEGKLRGNLECFEVATINYSGKIAGRLKARQVIIERRCEVQFFRRLRVGSIEIKGQMVGEVIADGVVNIHKNASLEGNVTAKGISVEKGGNFSGQLIIGQAALTQGELLPTALKQAPATMDRQNPEDLPGMATSVPAT